jgi:hypothetical protein
MQATNGLPGAPGRLIRVAPTCKGIIFGSRFVTPADPPFAVDDRRAADLIKQGHAVACAAPDPEVSRAVATGPRHAERAVARPARVPA